MQINSPSRETIRAALNARTQELIREGDLRRAEQVQQDLVILDRAQGETLYDIHRSAAEKSRSIRWPEYDTVSEWTAYSVWPIGAAVMGGVGGCFLLAVGLIEGIPLATGAGVAVLGGVAGLYGVARHRMGQRREANQIVEAAERQQSFIRGFVPSAPQPSLQIDRKVFMAALQGQEAALAENGDFRRAGDMRRVHRALDKLPGDTVEELFQNLITSGNREVLSLVQGSCSAQIAEAIETIAEVGKLVAPSVGSIREEADSIVIGGVVLKKSQKAAA